MEQDTPWAMGWKLRYKDVEDTPPHEDAYGQRTEIDNQHRQSQHRVVGAVIEVDTGWVETQRTVN